MSDSLSCHDLLFLILKHQPVKTLLQWRRVCKHWKEVIDLTSFILTHLALQTPCLLAHNREFEFLAFDPHTFSPFNTFTTGPHDLQIQHATHSVNCVVNQRKAVVGTAHGIVCIYDNDNLLLLWNPSIGRLLSLPLPETPWLHYFDYKCCGILIDPPTNEFKVVIFSFRGEKIALFSSRKKAWIEAHVECKCLRDTSWSWSGDPQVLIKGVGYWKLYDLRFRAHGIIVGFDFEQENIRMIEFPKGLEEVQSVDYMNRVMKWRDCLSVVHWRDLFPCCCAFWTMQSGSWRKMFSFNLIERTRDVLHVGEYNHSVLSKSYDGTLVLYDRKDGRKSRKLEFISSDSVTWAYDFVESLVFPDQNIIF